MTRAEAIRFNAAITTKGSKAKHLSTENYRSVHLMRVKIAKYLDEMGEKEKKLFEDYGFGDGDKLPKKKDDPKFWDKLEDIQKETVTIEKMNFIDEPEFRKFSDDLDMSVSSVLAEFLLKTE